MISLSIKTEVGLEADVGEKMLVDVVFVSECAHLPASVLAGPSCMVLCVVCVWGGSLCHSNLAPMTA